MPRQGDKISASDQEVAGGTNAVGNRGGARPDRVLCGDRTMSLSYKDLCEYRWRALQRRPSAGGWRKAEGWNRVLSYLSRASGRGRRGS